MRVCVNNVVYNCGLIVEQIMKKKWEWCKSVAPKTLKGGICCNLFKI